MSDETVNVTKSGSSLPPLPPLVRPPVGKLHYRAYGSVTLCGCTITDAWVDDAGTVECAKCWAQEWIP